jgi:hypothetical protein
MNKQTRRLREFGISTINNGPTHAEKPFDIFKGKECISEFALREKNPMNKRKSAWEGAGKRPVRERGAA